MLNFLSTRASVQWLMVALGVCIAILGSLGEPYPVLKFIIYIGFMGLGTLFGVYVLNGKSDGK